MIGLTWLVVALVWLLVGFAIDCTEVSRKERRAMQLTRAGAVWVCIACTLVWPWRCAINYINGEHPFT